MTYISYDLVNIRAFQKHENKHMVIKLIREVYLKTEVS